MNHHGHATMTYKQVLIVREAGPVAQAQISSKSTSRISTWCCVDQGTSEIEVLFDKNYFEPHETCTAHVNLNNKECNVALTSVSL